MMQTRKKSLLGAATIFCVIALAVWVSAPFAIHRIGGASDKHPADMDLMSLPAQEMIQQAIAGVDPQKFVDYHAHILGTGSTVPRLFLGEQLTSSASGRLMADIYKSGGGIRDEADGDQQFIDRLISLTRHSGLGGKRHILAYDQSYSVQGSVSPSSTLFRIPNEYVFGLSIRNPTLFTPVISVHPYNPNAIAELNKWAGEGVRYVKWSPPAMEFSPADPNIREFYETMAKHGMVLLSHGGSFSAARPEAQEFGNPLLLRLPLSIGVKVIVAHSASSGTCLDIDTADREEMACFDLFLRMLEEPTNSGQLFGDISAILNHGHLPDPLTLLLAKPHLHQHLVYGSDHPGPSINMFIRTGELVEFGFITVQERALLNEIYEYNPLLFDFVLQRTVKHPRDGRQFGTSIFQRNANLPW